MNIQSFLQSLFFIWHIKTTSVLSRVEVLSVYICLAEFLFTIKINAIVHSYFINENKNLFAHFYNYNSVVETFLHKDRLHVALFPLNLISFWQSSPYIHSTHASTFFYYCLRKKEEDEVC